MVKLVEMEFLRKKKMVVGVGMVVVRLDVVEMDELMSYSQRDLIVSESEFLWVGKSEIGERSR